MRPPRNALASTGSTAGGAFLRERHRSIAPSRSPPSIGEAKGGKGRDALHGAQANIEGNAEDPSMGDVDGAGHEGDAQASKHADANRKRGHAEFARAQSCARLRA